MASWRPPELPGGVSSRSRYQPLSVELQLQHQQEQRLERQLQQQSQQREELLARRGQGQTALQQGQDTLQQPRPENIERQRLPPDPASQPALLLEHQPLLQSVPGQASPSNSSNAGAAAVSAATRDQPRFFEPRGAANASDIASGNQLAASPGGPGDTWPGASQRPMPWGEQSNPATREPRSSPGNTPLPLSYQPTQDPPTASSSAPEPRAPVATGGGSAPPGPTTPSSDRSRRYGAVLAIMAVTTFLAITVFFVIFFAAWSRRAGRYRDTELRVATTLADMANLTAGELQLLRPGFHIQPAGGGWINDPNGLMQYRNMVHVFYQYNPYDAVWGPMHWGHVVSPDLVHWVHLPVALQPGDPWDRDGCWSGSALLMDDGVPRLYYTGVTNFSQYGYYYQTQAVALPADPGDPFLTRWLKPADMNPLGLALPPGGVRSQFRDPIAPWRVPANELGSLVRVWLGWPDDQAAGDPTSAGGGSEGLMTRSGNSSGGGDSGDMAAVWFTALGAMDDCVGAAALYSSRDLLSWIYAGTLFSQLGQNLTQFEECLSSDATGLPPGMRGYGGPCDQIGPKCRMWECPGFYTLFANSLESSKAQVAAEAAALTAAKRGGKAGPDAYGNITGDGGDGGGSGAGDGGASDALGGDVGVAVFKYSDQMRNRSGFAADWYQLGSPRLLNYSLAAYQDGQDVFSPTLLLPPLASPWTASPPGSGSSGEGNGTSGGGSGGNPGTGNRVLASQPQLLDYGTVYASQSFRMEDGRVVWLGWVYEDSLGCTEVCARGTPLTGAQGWQGMLTFPRTITYDVDLHQLIARPVRELQLLRSEKPLHEGSPQTLVEVGAAAGCRSGGDGGGGSGTGGCGSGSDGDRDGGGQQRRTAASRSCCSPLAALCRNGSVAAPAGPNGTAAAAVAAGRTAGGGAGGGSGTPATCGDSACWTLLAEELRPQVYGDAAAATSGKEGSESGAAASANLPGSNATLRSRVSAALRRQIEVELNFTMRLLYIPPAPPPPPPPPPAPGSQPNATSNFTDTPSDSPGWLHVDFELGMRLLTGRGAYVSVYINGTVPPPIAGVIPSEVPTLLGGEGGGNGGGGGGGGGGLYVERSCAGGMTNGTLLQGGWLPLWMVSEGGPPASPPSPPPSPPAPTPRLGAAEESESDQGAAIGSASETNSAPPDGLEMPGAAAAAATGETGDSSSGSSSISFGDSSSSGSMVSASGDGGGGGDSSGGSPQRVAILGTSLQVLVDHSVMEVFGGGGRARVTSRFYPAGEDVAWGVQAYARFSLRQAPGPATATAVLPPSLPEPRQRAMVGFQSAVYRLEDGI